LVGDLKKMNYLNKDVSKLETYIEITHINARSIITHFQTHILKDIFVSNILSNNTDFFMQYDATEIITQEAKNANEINYAQSLIKRIQELVNTMRENKSYENINATFNWIKVLCYHAYSDLGINASEKFTQLQRKGAISSV
jgi:flagellar basal body rod protein FlgC